MALKTASDLPPSISIVIPLFNEQESLRPLLSQIKKAMKDLGRPYEVIFVDDGSSDGSFQVLERLYHENDNVKVLQFRRNRGKATALSAGFREAKGEIIVTMDADLEDDPAEVPNLLAKINEGYDLVVGRRKKRRHPTLSKNLPSKLFNKVTSLVSGVKLHDINCGLKACKREVIENIKIYGELHRYFPVLAHMEGYRVGEVEVGHHLRQFGKSKYGWGRFIKGLLDLLTVMFMEKYLRRPLHLFGSVGLVCSFAGLVINIYITLLRIRFGNIRGRYPLLWLGILLMIVGIQFISVGLLGEMLTRAYVTKEDIPIKRRLT